jgi:hypothetical protein
MSSRFVLYTALLAISHSMRFHKTDAIHPCTMASGNPSARRGAKARGEVEYFVYVGTYTRQGSKGIYSYRFNPSTGKLESVGLAAQVANPSFLAVHPNQRFCTRSANWAMTAKPKARSPRMLSTNRLVLSTS